MKKMLYVVILLAIVFGACAPTAAPVATEAPVAEAPVAATEAPVLPP